MDESRHGDFLERCGDMVADAYLDMVEAVVREFHLTDPIEQLIVAAVVLRHQQAHGGGGDSRRVRAATEANAANGPSLDELQQRYVASVAKEVRSLTSSALQAAPQAITEDDLRRRIERIDAMVMGALGKKLGADFASAGWTPEHIEAVLKVQYGRMAVDNIEKLRRLEQEKS